MHSFEATAKSAAVTPGNRFMEHRWGTRRACRARLSVTAGSGITGVARLRDISMTGGFLETELPLHLYTQLRLAVLANDGSQHELDFPAVVVRRDPDGVGVEWCDPSPGRICQKFGCGIECGFAKRPTGDPS